MADQTPDRQHFSLLLVDQGGAGDVPAMVRLRLGLKRLLRAHGLRCESVVEGTPAPAATGQADPLRAEITRQVGRLRDTADTLLTLLADSPAGALELSRVVVLLDEVSGWLDEAVDLMAGEVE
jgi:hypothetical protein